MGIDHQLHQQHSPDIVIDMRHTDSGLIKAQQGVHLGILPCPLLLLSTILGILLYGARLAAVPPFSPFLILSHMAKAPPACFFIDLGAANLSLGLNHIDLGLLTAHKLADNLIYEAVLD